MRIPYPYNSWLCRSVWILQIVDILAACSLEHSKRNYMSNIYNIIYIMCVCVLMRIPYNSWLWRSVWILQIVDILAACSWSRKTMLLVIISVCFLRGRCRHVHHAPSDCYVSWPGSLGGGWCDECGALSAGCQITGHSAWAERCSPNVDSVLLHWYPERPPM